MFLVLAPLEFVLCKMTASNNLCASLSRGCGWKGKWVGWPIFQGRRDVLFFCWL
jgi:hypothetical protein